MGLAAWFRPNERGGVLPCFDAEAKNPAFIPAFLQWRLYRRKWTLSARIFPLRQAKRNL